MAYSASPDAKDMSCIGNSGKAFSCNKGTFCSHVELIGCSSSRDGVYCCIGADGSKISDGDGTNVCPYRTCWTSSEKLCCPINAQYACHGRCFSVNICGYETICND